MMIKMMMMTTTTATTMTTTATTVMTGDTGNATECQRRASQHIEPLSGRGEQSGANGRGGV